MRRVLVLLLVAFVGNVQAEKTGNQLYSMLKSPNEAENLRGLAYLEGVLDTEDWYFTEDLFSSYNPKSPSKMNKFKFPHFCLGNNKVTVGQVEDIVIKYLGENPQKRHITAQALVRNALLNEFPCANNPVPQNSK